MFLYTSNENSKKKIKKTIAFIIATKRIKYLGINLAKKVKAMYTENYKTLLEKIKDRNKWKDIAWLWIARINIKMPLLLTAKKT